MHTRDFSGKSVCILGFGREGRAMAEALKKYAPGCRISVADRNEQLTMDNGQWKNVSFQLGERYLENLDSFDVVIKSPGIPPLPELKAHNSKLITSTQIFFDSIAESGAIVIGVTGSKGKSTTSSLIFEILKKAGKDAYLIGNIGSPAIGYIERSKKNTIFVQEMSSAQLSDLTKSPQIAVVTAFFPEHLDYHGSLEAYQLAKQISRAFRIKMTQSFLIPHQQNAKRLPQKASERKSLSP
jgi:UDP-N-acetylmuramoylalanine--D-glutamate ligase